MNKQITTLWEQSAQRDDLWAQARYEKFAELIVQECANMAESFHRHQYNFTGNLELHEFIREHFGVEK